MVIMASKWRGKDTKWAPIILLSYLWVLRAIQITPVIISGISWKSISPTTYNFVSCTASMMDTGSVCVLFLLFQTFSSSWRSNSSFIGINHCKGNSLLYRLFLQRGTTLHSSRCLMKCCKGKAISYSERLSSQVSILNGQVASLLIFANTE